MAAKKQQEDRKASSEREETGKRSGQGGSDLKQREYRDKNGDVHHHTRKYMEQHGSEKE